MSVLVASIAAFGCSKNDSKPNPTNPTNPTGTLYSISAKINGVPFSRDSCIFEGKLGDSTRVNLLGWAGNSKSLPNHYPYIIIEFIYNYKGVGSYSNSNSSHNINPIVYLSDTERDYSANTTYEITITSVYPKVVGTFSFRTDKTVVTDGKFTAIRNIY